MRPVGQRPEVWAYAKYRWPGDSRIHDAYVEAVTSIESALVAVERLPYRDDQVEE